MLVLCLALGLTRARLCAEMSSAELSLWTAWFNVEPEPQLRADLRAGIVAGAVVNMLRVGGAAVRPEDFVLSWRQPAAQQDPEDMLAVIRGLAEGGSA